LSRPALEAMGHEIGASTAGKLLTDAPGFSRQVNRKAAEGSHHPAREGGAIGRRPEPRPYTPGGSEAKLRQVLIQ
jgi:hypothetical protein